MWSIVLRAVRGTFGPGSGTTRNCGSTSEAPRLMKFTRGHISVGFSSLVPESQDAY